MKKKSGKPDVIIDLSAMLFVWTDEKFAKSAGYAPEELIKKNVTDVLTVDKSAILRDASKALEKEAEDEKIVKKNIS